MTDDDYFADLPAVGQMQLRALAWKYLRINTIPDAETALRLLDLINLNADTLDAHCRWLEQARADVLADGRPWTQEELRRYAAKEGTDQ